MTTVSPTDSRQRFPADTASLPSTAALTTIGTLAWAGWLWGLVIVGNIVALTAVVRWGSMDESLWTSVFAGWQQWPMAGAGFTMVVVFIPMMVTNGVTRRRVAQAAAVTMVLLSAFLGAIITLGYAIEARVYEGQAWPHLLRDDGRSAAEVGYPSIFAAHVLYMALVFAAGWMVAAVLYRFGWAAVPLGVFAGLASIVALEILVLQDLDLGQLDFLDRFSIDNVGIGLVAATALVALVTTAAMRLTRGVDVD